jgi:hypothetical protein
MKEVSVSLKALKKLVDISFERDVQERAQIMVLNQPGMSNPEAAFEFARLTNESKPEAQKQVELRYRNLLDALKTGENVSEALSSFTG